MKRREVIAALVGAMGLKATDIELQELNPNGVFVLIVPKERNMLTVMQSCESVWKRIWKHTPKDKQPTLTFMTDDMKLVNLKDML